MPGLDPGIHAESLKHTLLCNAGASPAMTRQTRHQNGNRGIIASSSGGGTRATFIVSASNW